MVESHFCAKSARETGYPAEARDSGNVASSVFKHLPAYLDEMTWRFNNRKNPYLFRDTMLKLIHSENPEYKALVRAEKAA